MLPFFCFIVRVKANRLDSSAQKMSFMVILDSAILLLFTSPVLIGTTSCVFYHIFDRREPAYKSFDNVRENVKIRYIQARKGQIRNSF